MRPVAELVLEHACSLPEGAVVTAKGLLHLGSRAAIDQALSRLAREGRLLRVARGMYVAAVESRFGRRPPEVHAVAKALESVLGAPIESNGAAAANSLGLTTQVPGLVVYVTSGQSRKLKVGRQTLEVRHVPKWQMILSGRPAGKAVRALAWLGRSHVGEAAQKLRTQLPAEEWKALASARSTLPNWMAQAVSKAMQHA